MKFNHTAHKEMWNWLSENPESDKYDWPGWEWNGGTHKREHNYCFACGACEGFCRECPLPWSTEYTEKAFCLMEGTLFTRWAKCKNTTERSPLALQIANLPVKDGVETV